MHMSDLLQAVSFQDESRDTMHDLYKAFHAHPDLSMQEHHTAERIENELNELGIEYFRCGGTGVIALLRNGEGPTVAFRADTDGLPIEEQTGLGYASAVRGTLENGGEVRVSDGCGRDSHSTTLLTAAG